MVTVQILRLKAKCWSIPTPKILDMEWWMGFWSLFCWFKVILFHTVYHSKSPSNHHLVHFFLFASKKQKIQVLDVEFPLMILGDVNSQFYPWCLTLPYYTNTRVIKQQLRSPTFRDHPNEAGSVEIHCWGDAAGIYYTVYMMWRRCSRKHVEDSLKETTYHISDDSKLDWWFFETAKCCDFTLADCPGTKCNEVKGYDVFLFFGHPPKKIASQQK